MAKYFPMYTNLCGMEILIFGGGKKACEKIRRLMPFSPHITIAAQNVSDDIRALEGITVLQSGDSPIVLLKQLSPGIVIVADDNLPAEAIYQTCLSLRIAVNTVDNPALSTFIFPSMIQHEKLNIAISTSGASPAAAVKLRETIEAALPSQIDAILDWLAALRPYIKSKKGLPTEQHSAVFRALADAAFAQNKALDAETTERIIHQYSSR